MNQNTEISYSLVAGDIETINSCTKTIETIFSDFTGLMNQLGSDEVFKGVASQELQSKFSALKSKFDSFSALLKQFSITISSASEQTAATEGEIAKMADNLPN